jgi:hypothetical protein
MDLPTTLPQPRCSAPPRPATASASAPASATATATNGTLRLAPGNARAMARNGRTPNPKLSLYLALVRPKVRARLTASSRLWTPSR